MLSILHEFRAGGKVGEDSNSDDNGCTRSRKTKLGEVSVNKDAFDLDLKINEGYQRYSEELLRISIVALAALSTV